MRQVCNKVSEEKKAPPPAATLTYLEPEIECLVDQAAGGNFEAFGELYGIYLDPIYRYVYHQVNDRMTAEDVTEEVFVKAWQAIDTCKGKGKTFSAWLYRIAHNHLINTLRRLYKTTSLEKFDLPEKTDLVSEVEAKIEHQKLLAGIASLPPVQKQVIILKFIEGMENREISQVMEKSEGAIRIIQMRALIALRQQLGQGGG